MLHKILVVDDHVLIREGLKRALAKEESFRVVGEAASKREAFAQISHHNPNALVVDLHLPDGSGLEIIAWTRSLSQSIGIVALSFSPLQEHALACMQSGASAYIEKSRPIADLVSAIQFSIQSPLTFQSRKITSEMAQRNRSIGLTAREIEILEKLPTGDTIIQLAEQLYVTESTMKSHVASIYRKLNVKNRVHAINAARKLGLLP
jgi:DNA-binding NarL/FixJ family response regulator